MQDTRDDDAEDTLSLCDLPMYSDTCAECETQSSSSLSSSEQDHFEFFSGEFDPPITNISPQNIIFCGKLIPYKQPVPVKESNLDVESNQNRGGAGCSRDICSKNGTKNSCVNKNVNKFHVKRDAGYEFGVQKMSILTSSEKAKWYTFLFGITRFSTEIELRDMKNRQSRRRRHTRPSSPIFINYTSCDDKVSVAKNKGMGLWGFIKALSCIPQV
ncbi:uncharacterized protein Fot_11101 [Forsythia ovata]|uniref:Uncharacterized protein n=1 Tax=Forsythia ovata TaxID=205694 RepID=A0ABD1WIQ8_9LAMI